MKHFVFACAAALGLLAAATGFQAAHAHSPLKHSVPQDGAVVTAAAAPRHLELQFAHGLRLTSVKLRGPAQTVSLNPSREAAAVHQLPLPALAPGQYTVEWRGMATDGHPMSGTVRFSVTGD
jgi:methionine-rich copper-binding protein CopC